MTKTAASLFTGGGGFELGAMMAGYTPVWGVEIRPDIAAVAERNIPGLRVIVSDVAAVDYSTLPKIDHLHGSPSCKKASVANSDGGECQEDIDSARAFCRAIEAQRPGVVTLENVWGYREFESFKLIVRCLRELGYFVDWWHLNASDYGVPQTRKRLILIAGLDQQPRRPVPTHSKTPDPWGLYKPWVGWLESIADLVDTLPDSEFAAWQLSRLPVELKSMLLAQGGYEGQIVNRSMGEPAFTVTGNSNQAGVRALLLNSAFPGSNGKKHYEDNEPSFTVDTAAPSHARAFLLNRNKSERDDQADTASHGPQAKPKEAPAYTVCVESAGRQRALLVGSHYADSNAKENRRPQSWTEAAPAFTVTVSTGTHNDSRAMVPGGRVVKMTPRALARFQSIPDSYLLPESFLEWAGIKGSNGLACEIIGNAVPPLLAKAICESLKD